MLTNKNKCKGRQSSILLLLATVLSFCSQSFAITDLYSEQTYLSQQQSLASHIRLRAQTQITDVLTPYLQVGNELSAKAADPFSPDSASYVHVGPGLKFGLGPLGLYLEGRVRRFYGTVDKPAFDGRALLVYGAFFPTRISADWSRFAEPYSETVYSTADNHNIIHSSFIRLGYRYHASPSFSLDGFLEPFVTVDRLRRYYNNRADIKLNLRGNLKLGDLNLSLVGSYAWNQYFSRGDAEANPYRSASDNFRLLLVVGGYL